MAHFTFITRQYSTTFVDASRELSLSPLSFCAARFVHGLIGWKVDPDRYDFGVGLAKEHPEVKDKQCLNGAKTSSSARGSVMRHPMNRGDPGGASAALYYDKYVLICSSHVPYSRLAQNEFDHSTTRTIGRQVPRKTASFSAALLNIYMFLTFWLSIHHTVEVL